MSGLLGGVRAVMAFVDEPELAARWWSELLGLEHEVEDGFAWVDVEGVELGFHPADDERNPRGASPVVYWRVDDLDAARARLLAAGCEHWRGPLEVGPARRICQLRDPFGTIVGLDGP